VGENVRGEQRETQTSEANSRLEAMLIEGLTIGEDIPISPDFWRRTQTGSGRELLIYNDFSSVSG